MLKEIQAGFRETESLAHWVRKLRTPTCIFACNDVRAVQVLLACKLIKVQVPEQVAVLGVDNDELLAEFFDPKLSSIQPDTDFTAYKACEALDKLMSGEEVRYCQDYTEPLELVERESTNTIATNDPIVCEALKTIRKEACRGLRVNPN